MNYKNEATLKEHKGAVYALCKGKEQHIIYSGGSDRNVIQWDLEKMAAQKIIAKSPTAIVSLLYLEKFDLLLIGQMEGGVHVIDLKENKEIKYLKLHKGYIFDLKYHEVKKELIVASGDGSISIWSIETYEVLYHLSLSNKKIRALDFSYDQQKLAVTLGEGGFVILNTTDWSIQQEIKDFKSSINCLRFYPQKSILLAGEKDALLHQIDLISEEKKEWAAHYWAIYDIQFSPDGQQFATASRDKTVKIWDSNTVEVLKRFEGLKDLGHTHSVNKLLWLRYKNYLISTGDDASIKIWNTVIED